MTPTTGTPYNALALVTSKNAQQTISGTNLRADASAMDLLFNGILRQINPFTNALVDSFGMKPAANVYLAKTKACVQRMSSSTLRPANACASQFAAQKEPPSTIVDVYAMIPSVTSLHKCAISWRPMLLSLKTSE